MPKPKKLGKDVLGKSKGVGVIRTKKEQEDYEEYKRRKAEEQEKEKKEKKLGSEKMEEREPTPEQLAEQEAQVREDIARFKALKRGETVYVKEHHRRRPSAKEEHEEEHEEEEEEEE